MTEPTDLTTEDIVVTEREGKYQAVLGFLVHNGAPKFYQAWGTTPEEAKKFLLEVMSEHLKRALSTPKA